MKFFNALSYQSCRRNKFFQCVSLSTSRKAEINTILCSQLTLSISPSAPQAQDGADWKKTDPPYKVSEDTSRFKYTHKTGHKAAIRISRIVSESFRLGLPDVDWFVMGDDDTLFFTDNLVKVLSKYDPRRLWYIGSNSEDHVQNQLFSYNMAYGGGGFAISYPLAKLLSETQDACILSETQDAGISSV